MEHRLWTPKCCSRFRPGQTTLLIQSQQMSHCASTVLLARLCKNSKQAHHFHRAVGGVFVCRVSGERAAEIGRRIHSFGGASPAQLVCSGTRADYYLSSISSEYTTQRDLACLQFLARLKGTDNPFAYIREPAEIISVGLEMFYNVRLDTPHRYPDIALNKQAFVDRFPLLGQLFADFYGGLDKQFGYSKSGGPVIHSIQAQTTD